MFGILGVGLWAGKFYSCNDITVSGKSDCVGYYNTTLEIGGTFETGTHFLPFDVTVLVFADIFRLSNSTERQWRNAQATFDNIFRALLSLFQITTLDAWMTIAECRRPR
jgi:hypothetical protein